MLRDLWWFGGEFEFADGWRIAAGKHKEGTGLWMKVESSGQVGNEICKVKKENKNKIKIIIKIIIKQT
jgi:hypothetical protein